MKFFAEELSPQPKGCCMSVFVRLSGKSAFHNIMLENPIKKMFSLRKREKSMTHSLQTTAMALLYASKLTTLLFVSLSIYFVYASISNISVWINKNTLACKFIKLFLSPLQIYNTRKCSSVANRFLVFRFSNVGGNFVPHTILDSGAGEW